MKKHFEEYLPFYVAGFLLVILAGLFVLKMNKPPQIVVIDNCEYIRPQGQRFITHKGNCTNH